MNVSVANITCYKMDESVIASEVFLTNVSECSPRDKGRDLQCVCHNRAVINAEEVHFVAFEHYNKE